MAGSESVQSTGPQPPPSTKILRRYFLYDHKLLGKLSQCASKSLAKFFKLAFGKKIGIPRVVVAIQTFTAKSTLLGTMPGFTRVFTPWSLTV